MIDIVRFLGSVDLVSRRRSWEKDRGRVSDRFVEGYRRGLVEPDHLPRPPDIVQRLRAGGPRPARSLSRGATARCNRWLKGR